MDNLRYFIAIDTFLVIILICIFWTDVLDFINCRAEKTRKFMKNNEGFFSIFFIVLFAIEQSILIGLTTYFKEDTTKLRLIISIFALFVMTTASLQKFVLETKRRYEKEVQESGYKTLELVESYEGLIRSKDDIINKLIKKIKKN